MGSIPWRAAVAVVLIGLIHGTVADPEYEMEVEKLERLNDNGEYFTYNYTFDKVSEMKYSLSANIQQHKELDDSYMVKVVMARADLAEGSEYEIMINLEKTLCDYMRTIYKTYFHEELEKVSNFPHYDTCPLPATEYWIKDYEFDAEPYKEMMSEGRWKIEMMLLKGDTVCTGVVMINSVKAKA